MQPIYLWLNPIGWLFLLGILVLAFFLWKKYQLDLARHRLFCVRDDLFNLAVDGRLEFDSDAYRLLSALINGNIRFAHRNSFIRFFAFAVLTRHQEKPNGFQRKWADALASEPEDLQQELANLRGRLHYALAHQVIFSSALMTATLASVFLWALMEVLRKRLFDWSARLFALQPLRQALNAIDGSAVLHGSSTQSTSAGAQVPGKLAHA